MQGELFRIEFDALRCQVHGDWNLDSGISHGIRIYPLPYLAFMKQLCE